jgi:hypothetical protein
VGSILDRVRPLNYSGSTCISMIMHSVENDAQANTPESDGAAIIIQRAYRLHYPPVGRGPCFHKGIMQAMSIRTQQRKHIRKRMRLILIYAVFLLLFTYHQVTSTNDDDYFNFSNLVKKSITEELFQPSLSQSAWHLQVRHGSQQFAS